MLLPPAPVGRAGRRWTELPSTRRHELARLMTKGQVPPGDVEIVAALLQRRLATGWRLRAAAVGLGWLVLMTVWGYGRAQTGVTLGPWLAAGLVAAAVATIAQWRRVDDRLARWRARLTDLESGQPSPSAADPVPD